MTRKIILAGGSGMLGRTLAPWLAARGWEVIILTRQPDAGPPVPAPGGRSLAYSRWDGVSVGKWAEELEGAAVLVNLAGRSVNCRYTRANRRRIMHSRILSTCALGQALASCRHPPAVWLNSSTATIYRHTFDQAWDESGEIAPDAAAHDAFSIEVATAWEREFFTQSARHSAVRPLALRTAIVLANDPDNMVPLLRRLVKFGLGGRMGSGRQWVSWIHAVDFCRAIEFLLTSPACAAWTGPVNLAAPHPATNSQMMRLFRQAAGRRIGLPAARWMLEAGAFFLRTETELILKSRRVTPARLLEAGFSFHFPDLQSAVNDLSRARLIPRGVFQPVSPSSCGLLPPAPGR